MWLLSKRMSAFIIVWRFGWDGNITITVGVQAWFNLKNASLKTMYFLKLQNYKSRLRPNTSSERFHWQNSNLFYYIYFWFSYIALTKTKTNIRTILQFKIVLNKCHNAKFVVLRFNYSLSVTSGPASSLNQKYCKRIGMCKFCAQ